MVIICGDLSNSLPYNKIKYYTYSSYSWYSWLVYSGWSVVPNNWMSNCVLSEVPLLVVTRERISPTRPPTLHLLYRCWAGDHAPRQGGLNMSSQLSYPLSSLLPPHEELQSCLLISNFDKIFKQSHSQEMKFSFIGKISKVQHVFWW